jgi:hypothetical protein
MWGGFSNSSQRTSAYSNSIGGDFFDAIGTIRMEAFISPLGRDSVPDDIGHVQYGDFRDDSLRYVARRRSKELRRKASRSRQRERDSYISRGSTRGTDELEEWMSSYDPFKGF